jgi:hypothetical protein
MRLLVVLGIVGTVLILGAIISTGIRYERDMERVAEFYKNRVSQSGLTHATLPYELRPMLINVPELVALATGSWLMLVVVLRSRERAAAVKPSENAIPSAPPIGVQS